MLHQPIAERRSVYAFDPLHTVTEQEIAVLLEAARLAPSAMNRQPWAFLVGRRGDDTFKGIADALSGNNQAWAPSASSLLVAMVDNGDDSPTDAGRAYELGLAVGQLQIQASAMGLATHQMGGFDAGRVRATFDVPGHLRPMVVIAAGAQGAGDLLPDRLRQRDAAPRLRRPVEDLTLPVTAVRSC